MSAIARHWDAVRDALADEKRRKRNWLGSDEVTFLPAAMEVIETPVSPTGRITAWVLLAGLVVAIAWLTFGKVDVVASAPGKLVPAENVKLIQPADPGVVRAILVNDGQHVRAGQTLVELDPTASTADVEQVRKALQTAELDAARARAILSALDGRGLAFVAPLGTPADIAATERDLAAAQLANIEASAGSHAADRQAASAARAEAQVQAAKLTETLPLLDEQIAANEQLLAKGFVSKLKVIEMRRQRLSAARDRDAAVQDAKRAAAQMAGAGSGEVQSREEARAQVLSDLAKAEADARIKRDELTKALNTSSLQRLRSPVEGTVSQLSIHTIGGVVEAAKPIMVVVPDHGPQIAEVKVLNKDVGFVHVGQMVALKLEAFPFTRYGTVAGRVASIESDAVEDEKLGLVYPAKVLLVGQYIERDGDRVRLSPGLSATADIRTGRRTVLSYLLSPIDEAANEAGRER